MTEMDSDIFSLMQRRAYDIAGTTPPGIRVSWNGAVLPVQTFEDYIKLFPLGESSPLIHEKVSDRWDVYITLSSENRGFQQVSFVNSIATTIGGSHVSHVVTPLVDQVLEKAKAAFEGKFRIQRQNIMAQFFVFINCLIVNPTFNSQTKENMTSLQRDFGSRCVLGPATVEAVMQSGVVDRVVQWAKLKAAAELAKR